MKRCLKCETRIKGRLDYCPDCRFCEWIDCEESLKGRAANAKYCKYHAVENKKVWQQDYREKFKRPKKKVKTRWEQATDIHNLMLRICE